MIRIVIAALAVLALAAGAWFALDGSDAQAQDHHSFRQYTELLEKVQAWYPGETKGDRLVYASIEGMVDMLDPHSNFLDPEAYRSMQQRQVGRFSGLGIIVGIRDDKVTVISPIEGTPAHRLGIRAGDIITAIDGTPTEGKNIDDVVEKLRGPQGSQVTIAIMRRGLTAPLSFTITREMIPETSVRYAFLMDDRTGYVRITDFNRTTAQELEDALKGLEAKGMQQLLLDLRNNPGGVLEQAVEVTDMFLKTGSMVVFTRGRDAASFQEYRTTSKRTNRYRPVSLSDYDSIEEGMTLAQAEKKIGSKSVEVSSSKSGDTTIKIVEWENPDYSVLSATLKDGKIVSKTQVHLKVHLKEAARDEYISEPRRLPIIVMVNAGSASASEIVAGAMQDHDRAVIVGETTFGKGLVQSVYELGNSSALALTTARYHTPSGRCIQRDYSNLADYIRGTNGKGPTGEEYKTDRGRVMYGGGGITPDHTAKGPEVPVRQWQLQLAGGYFNFSVDYANRHPDLAKDFQSGSEVVEEFIAYLIKEEMLTADQAKEMKAGEAEMRVLRTLLRREILSARFGMTQGYQSVIKDDEQVNQALAHFGQAADLARLYFQ